MLEQVQVLVIHVRGQEERRQFIQKQLDRLGFPYQFIMEGNIADLTPEILGCYFRDNHQKDTMYGMFPHTSCAYKHILAYKFIVDNNLPGALILEDDTRLYSKFKSLFIQSLSEFETSHPQESIIANYEESSLLLVPRSKRRRGQILYQMNRDRFTGCFFINQQAAKAVLSFLEKEKCSIPVDRLHSLLVERGQINYYWSYPCLACQCSCDGSMPTLIPTKPRPFKRLKWYYKRFYKHFLYWLR